MLVCFTTTVHQRDPSHVPVLFCGAQVRAQTQLGQWSVPVGSPVSFVYAPILEAVEGNPGSVMGGGWINISATSDVFNHTHPNQNRVGDAALGRMHSSQQLPWCKRAKPHDVCLSHCLLTHGLALAAESGVLTPVLCGVLLWQVLVAGQRCELVPGTLTSTSLSCTAPPLWGRVLGEYWPINGYVPDLPADLEEWTNPGTAAAVPS
jgi:hypothetical protein